MRISDIPGDRALDVLADCIDAVTDIASDKELLEALQGEDMGETQGQLKAVAAVLKSHKDSVHKILAAIAGTSVEEYLGSHNAMQVLQDAFEVMTDEEALGFMPAARRDTGSRGSASESTGDPAE